MLSARKIVSNASAASAKPISPEVFYTALFSEKCFKSRSTDQNKTIGLAISGGVDSMALAYLCAKLQKSKQMSFRAFIVDHGARDGSAKEAKSVFEALEKLGITSRILTINWGDSSPAGLSNFETLARKARYRALGKACRESTIDALFSAHHEDDQVETVLGRLSLGHRGIGLRGMKSRSPMPDCRGLHGISESGDLPDDADEWCPYPTETAAFRSRDLLYENGSIHLYRPFLGFSKDQLVATCEQNDVPWFEDTTNRDPTVTMRNAIRHLRKSFVLPSALANPAILKLAESKAAEGKAYDRIAESLLTSCSVFINTSIGLSVCRFPDMTGFKDDLHGKTIAARILHRILMLSTPNEHVQTRNISCKTLFDRIFPEVYGTQRTSEKLFTVADLLFRRLPGNPETGKPFWAISRRPEVAAAESRMYITIPPCTTLPWTLYDGRYWFTLRNLHPTRSITIRPYRGGLWKPDQRLKALLKKMMPDQLIYVQPSLVLDAADGQKEKFLALPTLSLDWTNVRDDVQWKVRYKKVDLKGLDVLEDLPSPFSAHTGSR